MSLSRRSALLLASLPAILTTAGCYIYVPAGDPSDLPGHRASISLTDSGSVVMAPRVGAGTIDLEGTYLADSAGAFVLAMQSSRLRSGVESDWRGEHLAIPRALVASVARREFSKSRTTFAAALVTIGVVSTTLALRGAGLGGQGGSPIGGNPSK